MSHALTLADFAPALVGLAGGLMAIGAAFHATRGTRALRRRRREAADKLRAEASPAE